MSVRAVAGRILSARLFRRRLGILGVMLGAAVLLITACAPWLAPYDPLAQKLALRLQPPVAQHSQFGQPVPIGAVRPDTRFR